MAYQLDFDHTFRDVLARNGIFLPITLHRGDLSANFEAQVDTGASCCIFERRVGENLGLTIESGFRQNINTVTGAFTTYGHTVVVSVLGIAFEAIVYFAEAADFNRNVLGRAGWLDRVKLGLVYHENEVYLGSL
ncbi:MAG TPA: aspartyl protease family protein [Pyrinomonadaceae bacterium]|nr:aspartyl protease family protein [Pyrinomonadaceae bacterium]